VNDNIVPQSRLIEFAQPVRREVVIDPVSVYRTIGCHLYGGGVYERETKTGVEIKASRMFAVQKGELVINRIWAQKGSAGIVPGSLAGAVVTQDFPVWMFDTKKAFPSYVGWYLKTPSFWEECRRHSHGTSGRERLNPKEMPNILFPLPPIDEQRRIVARIEELATLIEEAQELRVRAREEARVLLGAASAQLLNAVAESNASLPIGEIISFRNDLIRPSDRESGPLRFVGLQHVEPHTGRRIGEDRLLAEELGGRKFKFSSGEIVYGYLRPYLNKVWVADREGACSVDQYVIRPDPAMVITKYLAHFMRSPIFLGRAIELTHNLLLPRLRKALLESISIPLPPVSEQRHVVAYLDEMQAQVNELTALQDATQAELDALLPSVLDRAFRGEL
jgi:type I restriction enzyme S subunit